MTKPKTLKDLRILSIEGPAINGAVMYEHDVKQMFIDHIKAIDDELEELRKMEEAVHKSTLRRGAKVLRSGVKYIVEADNLRSQQEMLMKLGNLTEEDLKEKD